MILSAPHQDADVDLPPSVFSRDSVERRVLGNISDEENSPEIGPKNNLGSLTYELVTDTYTPINGNPYDLSTRTIVQDHLDRLVEAGLAREREDDIYERTEAGWVELET